MKIVYYIHNLVVGGAETLVVDYLIKLKEKGCQVILVENEIVDTILERKLRQHGIQTIGLMPSFSYTFFGKVKRTIARKTVNFSKRWKKILQHEKPDILHVHTFTDRIGNIDFPASRMVYTFHADMERSLQMGSAQNLENLKKLAAGGMKFFAVNELMQEQIRERFHTENTAYIPNCVDIGAIRGKRYDRKAFLEDLGISESAFVLGQVGRFHPVKNHEKTIEVFGEIVGRGVDAYLLLLGIGDAQRTQLLQDMVNKQGLTDRVRFLGLREDATQIMSIFDAMILPSYSESFSLVLVEAQIHGVRCVASAAVPDEVICNRNCFKLDIQAPAREWADLLLADSERSEQGDLDRFDLETVVDRMMEAYRSV